MMRRSSIATPATERAAMPPGPVATAPAGCADAAAPVINAVMPAGQARPRRRNALGMVISDPPAGDAGAETPLVVTPFKVVAPGRNTPASPGWLRTAFIPGSWS